MKKIMTAEVNFIYLNANDMITTSGLDTLNEKEGYDNGTGGYAPSRFNYRGAEMGCEDNEW